jgi:hypothetical protein
MVARWIVMSLQFVAALLALTSLLTASSGAFARDDDRNENDGGKTVLALDLEYAGPIDEGSVESGSGGAVRLGRRADLIAVSLTGELGGSYHQFSGSPEVQAVRGFIGGRLSVAEGIEPGIYAHLGVGRLSVDPGESRTSPTLDAGLFLDLTILPLVDLGVHAGYDTLLGSGDANAFDYYVVGAHAALVF